jgi:hypothetical protein
MVSSHKVFWIKFCMNFPFLSWMQHVPPISSSLIDHQVIFSEDYRLWSSSLSDFLLPFTSFHLGTYLLSTMVSKTLNLCCSLHVTDQIFVPVHTQTKSMEQRPSWNVNSYSATQEISCLLWNLKVHYNVCKRPPLAHKPATGTHIKQKVKLQSIAYSVLTQYGWCLGAGFLLHVILIYAKGWHSYVKYFFLSPFCFLSWTQSSVFFCSVNKIARHFLYSIQQKLLTNDNF